MHLLGKLFKCIDYERSLGGESRIEIKPLILNFLCQHLHLSGRKIPFFLNGDGSFPADSDPERPTQRPTRGGCVWDAIQARTVRGARPRSDPISPARPQGKEAIAALSQLGLGSADQQSSCRCSSVSTGRCSASVITGSACVSTTAPSFSAAAKERWSSSLVGG